MLCEEEDSLRRFEAAGKAGADCSYDALELLPQQYKELFDIDTSCLTG